MSSDPGRGLRPKVAHSGAEKNHTHFVLQKQTRYFALEVRCILTSFYTTDILRIAPVGRRDTRPPCCGQKPYSGCLNLRKKPRVKRIMQYILHLDAFAICRVKKCYCTCDLRQAVVGGNIFSCSYQLGHMYRHTCMPLPFFFN